MKFTLWVARASSAPFARNFEAPTLAGAVSAAHAEGLNVIDSVRAGADVVSHRRGSRRFSVHLFTQELVALLEAGLTLLEGLRALSGKAEADERRILQMLVNDLLTGKRFSDALEIHPEFPSIYVSLVRASEETSDLPTSLQRYLVHSTQMDEARQKAVSAAIYPALLIVVGGAALVFLLLYVVPRFSGIYDGMRGELPWSARLMMQWSHGVKDHGSEIIVSGLLVVLAAVTALTTGGSRLYLVNALHRLPYLGEQLRLFHMARLFRTVGMLLEGGIPLVSATEMSLAVLPIDLKLRATTALARMREGVKPSMALREQDLSSSVADQMLLVGERSGELGSMMSRVAAFYEADTTRKLERAMSVF